MENMVEVEVHEDTPLVEVYEEVRAKVVGMGATTEEADIIAGIVTSKEAMARGIEPGEECICSEKRTCNFHRGNPSPTEGPTGPSSRSAHALEEHRRNVARLDDRVLVSWLRDLAQSLQRQGRSRYPASALAEEAANRIES